MTDYFMICPGRYFVQTGLSQIKARPRFCSGFDGDLRTGQRSLVGDLVAVLFQIITDCGEDNDRLFHLVIKRCQLKSVL